MKHEYIEAGAGIGVGVGVGVGMRREELEVGVFSALLVAQVGPLTQDVRRPDTRI